MSDEENKKSKRNPNEIGAIWQKESSAGKIYYFGKIQIDGKEHQFVMFKNDYKEPGSKQPDWRIQKSVPNPNTKQPTPQTNSKPAVRPAAPTPSMPGHSMSSPIPRPMPPKPAPATTVEQKNEFEQETNTVAAKDEESKSTL